MASVSSSKSRRRLLLLTEALLLAGTGATQAFATADPIQPEAAVAAEDLGPALDRTGELTAVPGETLLLMLWLNGEDRGVIEVRRDGETFWTTRAILRGTGLQLPGDGADPMVALDRLPGATLHYDADMQVLELMVPPEMLGAARLVLNPVEDRFAEAHSAPGALLSYDAYAGIDNHSANLSGLLEFRAFGGRDVFDTTVLAGWREGSDTHLVRLESAWSRTWPERRLRLVVGDTVTSAVEWSRATRIGGVQIGTDFSLQPYMPTAPSPAFFGSAVLPSQLELYINGVRTWNGEAPAGTFELSAGPTRIDGAGQAQVVMTDALGRVTTRTFAIYHSPALLRAGLSEWSAEAGLVRRDYGLDSFGYADEPVFSGSVRHGVSNGLTLETHAEAAPHLAQGGIGAVLLLGQLGVVTGSVAASRTNAGTGTQWSAGYNWTNGAVYLAGSVQRASRSFADLATRWDGPPLRARDQLQAGVSSRRLGAAGAHYIRYRPATGAAYRAAGLNWTRGLGRNLSLYASAEQNLDARKERRFMLSLSFTPGGNYYGNLSWQNDRGRDRVSLTAQRSAAQAGGLGWNAGVQHDLETGGVDGQAQASWLGSYGEARVGVASFGGRQSALAGYSGSLALIGGSVYASRRVDDGFALVTTGGYADIPVTVENNVIGRTDRNGRLLVTRLNAYERNRIGIDPSHLPAEVAVEETTAEAVPGRRAGVIVDFALRELTAAVLTVTQADGTAIAAGSTAWLEGRDEPLTVGFDGQLYIENPPPGGLLSIETEGQACTVRLPERIETGGVTRLGAQRCEVRP